MGVIGLATRGVKTARPYADAVRDADGTSREGGQLAVLPGDREATRRLRELLGNPAATPSEDALAVVAITDAGQLDAVLPSLRRRRRSGAGALAILIGTRAARAALERAVVAGGGLEVSNVAHVASLEGPGARAAIDAVIRALGPRAVAAGRLHPALRGPIGAHLVRSGARQAAAIGAVPLAGADMPVLALLHVRLLAQLAALHDRPFGAERAVEALAAVGAGFGWRALGRSAVGLVPGAGWAARGGVAYAATRAVGEAALARLSAGHDLISGPPIERARPQIDKVLGRLRRS
ncbi:MAG: hypothetical protein AB7V42_01825 [Thermoleophilia bacterium]